MSSLCFPYQGQLTCLCDRMGRVLSCQAGQADRSGHGGTTEVVLATTLLVAVVLLFISFLMYRCEKVLYSTDAKMLLLESWRKSRIKHFLDWKSTSASSQTDPIKVCYSQTNTIIGITSISQDYRHLPGGGPVVVQQDLYREGNGEMPLMPFQLPFFQADTRSQMYPELPLRSILVDSGAINQLDRGDYSHFTTTTIRKPMDSRGMMFVYRSNNITKEDMHRDSRQLAGDSTNEKVLEPENKSHQEHWEDTGFTDNSEEGELSSTLLYPALPPLEPEIGTSGQFNQIDSPLDEMDEEERAVSRDSSSNSFEQDRTGSEFNFYHEYILP